MGAEPPVTSHAECPVPGWSGRPPNGQLGSGAVLPGMINGTACRCCCSTCPPLASVLQAIVSPSCWCWIVSGAGCPSPSRVFCSHVSTTARPGSLGSRDRASVRSLRSRHHGRERGRQFRRGADRPGSDDFLRTRGCRARLRVAASDGQAGRAKAQGMPPNATGRLSDGCSRLL
jgi:hypothetical protein